MDIVRSKLLFGFLFLVIILFSVSAAPPTQTNVNIDVGLEIQYPAFDTITQGTPFDFQFHVFNKSNGLAMSNDTTSCRFHLFNNTGQHIVEGDLEMAVNLLDYEISVGGSNFTTGAYSYIVQCNSSDVGGFVAVPITVTPTGQALDEPQSLIILGLILVLILLSCAFLYFGKVIEYLPFKIFLISLGSLFLMFTVGFSVNIINQLLVVGSVFSATFVSLYRLMLILVSAGGIGLLVYLVYMAIKQFYSHRGLMDKFDDD